MKRGLCALAIGVCASAVGLSPATVHTAHAATVQACVQNVNWTFSPPLTTTDQSGTGTFSWTHTCFDASTSGATGFEPPESGSLIFTYTGSCVSAVLTSGVGGLLIGGTIALIDNPAAQEFVLVPGNPCNDSGPTPSTGSEQFVNVP